MTLTSREKILIFILILMVIILGGFKFFIEPSMKQYSELKSQMQQLSEKQIQMKTAIDVGDALSSRIQTETENARQASRSFFESLKAGDLQFWVSDLAQASGASLNSFSVSQPQVTAIVISSGSQSSATYPLQQYADQIDNRQAASSSPGSTSSGNDSVLMSTVTLSGKSTVAGLMLLLDKISQSGKTARVDSLSYNTPAAEGSLTDFNMTLQVYAVEKLD